MVRSIDWLRQSEAEFKAATDLLNTNNFAWCCFTAQQSAEKSIKAILNHIQCGALGHNLNTLIQEIEQHLQVDKAVVDACIRLNRLYIPTRYPDAFASGVPAEQYFDQDANQAVQDAEEVLHFARTIIQPTTC
jgi:HEPN domain-containing protein